MNLTAICLLLGARRGASLENSVEGGKDVIKTTSYGCAEPVLSRVLACLLQESTL